MTSSQSGSAIWPADVIHVNEDGWVLVNRGRQHGVTVGLHLLVVGAATRELYDLYAPGSTPEAQPLALRIRRTYELLEVVHAEESCAIAIATRTPTARRPVVYRGPEGELLVWVPLPEGYTWPPPASGSSVPEQAQSSWDTSSENETTDDASDQSAEGDLPPEHGPQDDEPWEEALPLNSVSVGDSVLPAIAATPQSPVMPPMPPVPSNAAAASTDPESPFESGRTYDWMKKPGE